METDLDTVLEDWELAKEKIKKLEGKIEKYKKSVNKVMDKRGTNKLTTKNFSVEKRKGTRTYLTKANVPASIWSQYSTRCSYDSYYLTRAEARQASSGGRRQASSDGRRQASSKT